MKTVFLDDSVLTFTGDVDFSFLGSLGNYKGATEHRLTYKLSSAALGPMW